MITNKESLLSLLKEADIDCQLYEHPPVYTVDEAMRHCAHIPGAHVKNLFLRNKKKTTYLLVTVKEVKRVNLLTLGEKLKIGRLSFASDHDLDNMLGVTPGSVTPIAIINDKNKKITLIFDEDLLKEEYINIHPMTNTATISMKLSDLLKFIENDRQEKIAFVEI